MSRATLFRHLVKKRDWTSVDTFIVHFAEAARQLAERVGDSSLADVEVSRRSFDRWMAGELERMPHRKTRRILEYLFDEPAARLFRGMEVDGPCPSPGPEDERRERAPSSYDVGLSVRSASVDPGLVPHWSGMLHVLAASHNVFGSRQIHGVVSRELGVIRDHRLRADGGVRTGLVSVEARWAEFASWTAEGLGNGKDAAHWLGYSLDLAREGGDGPIEAYVLMRQAQRAAERRDARAVHDLADAAWAAAGASHRDRALCAVRLAQGHALTGDSRLCSKAIRMAHQLVAQADELSDDDTATIGRHCVPAYVQAHEAYCRLLLGHPRQASRLLVETLASWPPGHPQDEHIARAWLALAYAAQGRIAEAALEGAAALGPTTSSDSARVLRSLTALDRQMAVVAGSPEEVAQFRSAFTLTAQRIRS
ncbi:hypothetical protein [Streptomyces sp. NPDC056672]|uniref:hypothetical protein n=1 Tax=Streptomyces sp. NPDC056672 TaxID=3345906 RepID=UPI0036785320